MDMKASKGSRLLPGGGSDDFYPFQETRKQHLCSHVNGIYGAHYTDLCYGYRAFKREALEKLHCISNGFEIETEQSVLMRKKVLKLKRCHPSSQKKNGNSNLNSIRDGWRILSVIFKKYLIKS